MATVLINSHKVKDFAQWKEIFDNGAPMRLEAGIKVKSVYQLVDDANHVTVISEVPSVEAAKTIIANLKGIMEKGGVIAELMDTKIVNEI